MSTNELDDPFDIPTTPAENQHDEFGAEFADEYSDTPQNDDQAFLQSDDHFPDEPVSDFEPDQSAQHDETQAHNAPANQVPAQPKPFLKTPFGMAICGVAVLGVVGVGVTAYKVTNPPMSEDMTDSSSEVTPAPVKHDPAPEVDFGGGQQEPVVSAEAREVKPAVVTPEKSAAQVLNLTEVKPQGFETVPVAVQVAPVPVPLPPVVSAHEEELKKLIAEQQQTTEELQKNNAALTQALSKLSKVVEKSREAQIVLSEQVVEIKESLKPAAKPVVAQATSPSAAPAGTNDTPAAVAPANPLTEGRTRIPGLQVVNTTPNGDMSIVKKVSNGRVFTMFKGENIGTVKGNFKITEVLEKGSLLLLGDKYYIDTVAEEWSSSSKAAAAPEPKPEPKAEAKKAPVKREVQPKPEVKAKPTPVAQCRKFTLNAVYDAGKSFGVVSSAGDFNSYKVGDNMPGVGVVKGLDGAGNLNAGDCVIESVY
ncbi:hypothetical protein [Pseudomonas sp. PLMAX]|uniref:hypothetical protein n=1 Tax=Pseudomonas sp. PLMAX TaxID=2201998 RepID=UPI0038BA91A7